MFNLVVLSVDWQAGRETLPLGRSLEYTEEYVKAQFAAENQKLDALQKYPCIFMQEGVDDEIARVGQINRAQTLGYNIEFEYAFDPEVPPLTNKIVFANKAALGIKSDFEFSRNHWALKDIDLYRFLLRMIRPRRQRPMVFQIPEHENIEAILVSAMMPFNQEFAPVYQAIKSAAENTGLRARRADDIWENPAVIQDVVSLIDRSRIVICDCTGKNPNVFYEAGIAHTLGREVILITQSQNDIPFDLRHLRYVPYLNNAEGLAKLTNTLKKKMEDVLGH
jgi:hypothetical protein